MDLQNILAISGKPGLYRLISSNAARLLVESLSEKKKLPVSPTAKVSSLGDIAIFTMEEDVPLSEVFNRISNKVDGGQGPDHKSKPEELRAFLNEILDDLDHSRVYDSDLKKLFQWYNILQATGLLVAEESADAEAVETVDVEEVADKSEDAESDSNEKE